MMICKKKSNRKLYLRFEERCSIKIYKKLRYSLRRIGEAINCADSTVLNELRRGMGTRHGDRGRFPEYSAKRGQANYEVNRSRCHKPHKADPNSPFKLPHEQLIKEKLQVKLLKQLTKLQQERLIGENPPLSST